MGDVMVNLSLETLAEGFVFLEGPRWHDGKLWLSDMWGHTVYTLAEDGSRAAVANVPNRPSGINFMPDGTPVVVSMADRKLLRIGADGELSEHADISTLARYDINDTVFDEHGNIYVGHFGYDLFAGDEAKMASLILVQPDGKCSVVADDMNFPNGTVLANGGKTLICAETFGHVLTAFDRGADGALTNRRVWAELGERTPDGICLDLEGAIWVSSFMTDEFVRVREGGEVTHRIACAGKRAVACNLGGSDGKTLFAFTFAGELDQLASGEKNARVEVCRVEVPSAGSP